MKYTTNGLFYQWCLLSPFQQDFIFFTDISDMIKAGVLWHSVFIFLLYGHPPFPNIFVFTRVSVSLQHCLIIFAYEVPSTWEHDLIPCLFKCCDIFMFQLTSVPLPWRFPNYSSGNQQVTRRDIHFHLNSPKGKGKNCKRLLKRSVPTERKYRLGKVVD